MVSIREFDGWTEEDTIKGTEPTREQVIEWFSNHPGKTTWHCWIDKTHAKIYYRNDYI